MNYLFRLSIFYKEVSAWKDVGSWQLVLGERKVLKFKCLKGQLACNLINKKKNKLLYEIIVF